MSKYKKHYPFHLYSGHTYAVSGRCQDKLNYFESDFKKEIFKRVLNKSIKRFKIRLFGWIILPNHYHLLFALPEEVIEQDQRNVGKEEGAERLDFVPMRIGTQSNTPLESTKRLDSAGAGFNAPLSRYTIVEFIRKIHKDTAREINKLDSIPGRQVWYQYWDYCVRNQPDFWFHFNYIIQNPLKHGLVQSLYEAYHYKFSSNPIWLARFGKDGLWESFVRYPVKDWTSEEE